MKALGPASGPDGRLRIGVLGAAGQIGTGLVRAIRARPDWELAFAVTRGELDLADLSAVEPYLARWARAGASAGRGDEQGLDVVVNAAAFTQVDACERREAEARVLNAQMPGVWARALGARGVALIHLSTDYVFPGDGTRPLREEDPTGPRSAYGRTKLEGEERVRANHPEAQIVRTSWVFGPGRNFVAAILAQVERRRRGEEEGPLRVVADQRGCPTSASDLAEALLALARRAATREPDRPRLLHLCNAGETSWFDFAREILAQTGDGDLAIEPVETGAFPTAAPRPAYSVLDTGRAAALGIRLRAWQQALAGYLAGPDRPTHRIAPGS